LAIELNALLWKRLQTYYSYSGVCKSHYQSKLREYSEVCASDDFLAAHLRVKNPNAIVRVNNDCGKEDLLRKVYWMENEKNKPTGMIQLCQAQKGKHSVAVFHF